MVGAVVDCLFDGLELLLQLLKFTFSHVSMRFSHFDDEVCEVHILPPFRGPLVVFINHT